MRSEDALVGTRVRIREDAGSPEPPGRHGKIVASYGSSGHAALDVLLDDGRTELFWFYQLEEAEKSA